MTPTGHTSLKVENGGDSDSETRDIDHLISTVGNISSRGVKADLQIYQEDASSSTENISRQLDEAESSVWTYRICVAGLVLMWLTGLSALVYGSIAQSITDNSSGDWSPSMIHHRANGPFLQLAVTFWITALSDIAGLVHSTSLRFALLASRKLTFNSNLRLFTSCPNSRLHSWPINIIWGWSLISSYACGSMVLLETVYSFGTTDSHSLDVVSGYAIIFLGFGLLGQAAIATWALTVNNFPTWSTNPIYIAIVCQSQGWMSRLSRRSILSVHEADDIAVHETPTVPKLRQGSLLKANFRVRRALTYVWVVAFLAALWFVAVTLAYQLGGANLGPVWGSFSRSYTNDWSIIPNWVDHTAFLAIPTSLGQSYFSFGPWFLCKYLLTGAFLAGITIDLHIVELFVQCSRDESLWRQTAARGGLSLRNRGAFFIAFSTWQTVVLFVFKTIIHWMFSLAFGLMWEGIEVRIPQVCYTAITLFSLSVLTTCLALYRPSGPQPATFGHIPTLIDLIDVWPLRLDSACQRESVEEDCEAVGSRATEPLTWYWGDKGEDADGIRRAGTAFTPLEPIVMNAMYW